MKKTVFLISAGLLAMVLLSCSNSGHTSGTSLVTLKVGSDKTASISIQQSTRYAKLKNFLADHLRVRSAEALIPSNVASINVTVSASDMPTITQTIDTAGVSSVTIVIEVPNGLNRQFTITGFDTTSAPGAIAITYWGRMSADLNGSSVFLSVPMINLGSVTGILHVSTSGNDTTGDGTEQNPYRTITQALRVTANVPKAIFVEPGTYNTNGGESFPLQLNPGTALVCLGANNSTVLDSSSDGIYGNAGASVQFCTVRVCDATGISDGAIGAAGNPMPIRINQVLLDEQSPGCGALDAIVLGADSSVVDTVIRNPFNSGITVNAGSPSIRNNTITGNNSTSFYGIDVTGGSARIDSTAISGFNSGILISAGTPTITNSTFVRNGIGISVTGGSPFISTSSLHNNNSCGISVATSSSIDNPVIHSNSINCNFSFNLCLSATMPIDVRNNSWEHDPPLAVNQVTAGCSPGTDICYSGPAPLYQPFNAAVPGVCVRPVN